MSSSNHRDSPFRKTLFGRTWDVRVSTENSVGVGQAEAIKIVGPNGLDLRFKISKTTKPEPNKCELEIYNLAQDVRHSIEALNKYDPKKVKGAGTANRGILAGKDGATRQKAPKTGLIRVEIRAGYEQTGSTLLFRGDLRRALSKFEDDGSWKTEIKGEDGGRTILTSRVRLSYPAGTKLRTAVEDCADAMGIGLGNVIEVESILASKYFSHGTILDGQASKEMAGILRRAGLRYSVADNALLFLPVGKGRTVKAVLLNSESGLIGAPERDSQGYVRVVSLINPDLALGGYVQVDSLTLQGTYRIEKMDHEGSTFGNDWYTTCYLKP